MGEISLDTPTAVINQIAAFLIEYGLPVEEGRASLSRDLPPVLEDAENALEVFPFHS